jgi:hypothetical protein
MCGILPTDKRSICDVFSRAFLLSHFVVALAFGPVATARGEQFTSELRSSAEPVEVTIGQAVVISGSETRPHEQTRQSEQTGQIEQTQAPQQTDASQQGVEVEPSDAVVDDTHLVTPAETTSQASDSVDEVAVEEMPTEQDTVEAILQSDQQTENVSGLIGTAETADTQGVIVESAGEVSVDHADALNGPSEELQEVIEVLHASAESVEQLIDAAAETDASDSSGSFLRIMESSPYHLESALVETLEVPSPSDLDAAESMDVSQPSLQELRRQRAEEMARLRALRLQQQIRSGYSPLRPRWNAIPMMSSRYSRPVVYVPVYVR